MDIAGTDIATKNALAAQYAGQGVLVIQDVALPAGFEPSATDVVFLAVDGACEIYIDARITYTGPAPFWHDRCGEASHPATPGSSPSRWTSSVPSAPSRNS